MPVDDTAPIPDDAYYQAILAGLVRDGAKLSADLVAEEGPAGPKAEPYERITRGMRRTVLLSRHIAENPIRTTGDSAETAKAKVAIARRQIARAIDDDIVSAADDPDHLDSLRDELRERMEDPALDLEILHGSVADIIAAIRRDFGLTNSRYSAPNTRTRRTPDQVRDLHDLAAGKPDPATGAEIETEFEQRADERVEDEVEAPTVVQAATLARRRAVRGRLSPASAVKPARYSPSNPNLPSAPTMCAGTGAVAASSRSSGSMIARASSCSRPDPAP